jgi:hypothetical protein
MDSEESPTAGSKEATERSDAAEQAFAGERSDRDFYRSQSSPSSKPRDHLRETRPKPSPRAKTESKEASPMRQSVTADDVPELVLQADMESKETQTDMPLSSNMKTASVQTDAPAVERLYETRRLLPRKRTKGLLERSGTNDSEDFTFTGEIMTLTKILKLQKRQKEKTKHKKIHELSQGLFRNVTEDEADTTGVPDDKQSDQAGVDKSGGLAGARRLLGEDLQPKTQENPSHDSSADQSPEKRVREEQHSNASPKVDQVDSSKSSKDQPEALDVSGTSIKDDGLHRGSATGVEAQEATADAASAEISDMKTGTGGAKVLIGESSKRALITDLPDVPSEGVAQPHEPEAGPEARNDTMVKQLSVLSEKTGISEEALRAMDMSDADAQKLVDEMSDDKSGDYHDDHSDVVEVVDIMQQTGVRWEGIPDAIISWLKLNLMQKMQAEFYCTPWTITELEWWPELKLGKRKRMIDAFEYFITNVLGRPEPTKHEVRRRLRQTYRSTMRGPDAQEGPESDSSPERNDNANRSLRRPNSKGGRRISESPVPSPLKQRLLEADTEQPLAQSAHQEERNMGIDSNKPLAATFTTLQMEDSNKAIRPPVQIPVFTSSPFYKKLNTPVEKPQTIQHSIQNLVPNEEFLCDGKSLTHQLRKPGAAEDKVVAAQEVEIEKDILGFELPESVFDGSTDQDPYQLSVAAKEGVKLPSGAKSMKIFSADAAEKADTETELPDAKPLPSDLETDESGPDHSPLPYSPPPDRVQKLQGMMEALQPHVINQTEHAFVRLKIATSLPLIQGTSAFEHTKGMSISVRPPENRNPWRGAQPKIRGNAGIARILPPPAPDNEEVEYLGAVSWAYRAPDPQPAAEPEPEAPLPTPRPAPPKEPTKWTQKRAEDLIRALADPRDHMANIVSNTNAPRGKAGRLGFRPGDRRLVATGAKPEDPDPLKPGGHFVPAGPPPPGIGPSDSGSLSLNATGKTLPPQPPPESMLGSSSSWHSQGSQKKESRRLVECPANWMPTQAVQATEVSLPQIGSPQKDVKRNSGSGSLKTPREGPKFGGTG